MSELLSSIIGGGGGGFVAKFASGTINVTAGATGTFATLTPPSGQKVKLTAIAGTSSQTSLTTISVGGADVVSAVSLSGAASSPTTANRFMIGFEQPNQEPITGDVDEVIELKTNVSTSSNTVYTYQFGE